MAVVTRYVNTGSTPGGDGTTNNTTGATRAYASLSEWESNEQTDLVTATDSHVCIVDGSGGEDTTQLVLNGWTTSATYDVTIKAEGDQRCDGLSYDNTGSGYRLSVDGASAVRILIGYANLEGFEIHTHNSGPHVLDTTSGNAEFTLTDMLVTGDQSDIERYSVDGKDSTGDFTITNCLFIVSGSKRRALRGSGVVDHCGFYSESTVNVVNVGASSTVTNSWSICTGGGSCFVSTGSGSNNASSDTTAGSEFTSSIDNLVAANEFTNPTSTLSTADFSLLFGSNLVGVGTGSEAEDITNSSRVGTVDIGPFELPNTGTGDMAAQDSTASGSATIVYVGTGSLLSDESTASGTATRIVTASGTLESQDSTVAGTAFSDISGSLIAQPATVVGSAGVSIDHTATGVLVASSSIVAIPPAAPTTRTVSVAFEVRSITV